jgi:hypothetical protein
MHLNERNWYHTAGEHQMFSEFVNFKEIELIVNNNQVINNFGLITLDISHDNETYQLFVTCLTDCDRRTSFPEFIKEQIKSNNSLAFKIKYELKKSKSEIVDLYNVLADNNRWLKSSQNSDSDIFTLSSQLQLRSYLNFDYDNEKVVNY